MEKSKETETPKSPQRTSVEERMNDISSMRIEINGSWISLIDNKEELKPTKEVDEL
jgi:hypothetical protein